MFKFINEEITICRIIHKNSSNKSKLPFSLDYLGRQNSTLVRTLHKIKQINKIMFL